MTTKITFFFKTKVFFYFCSNKKNTTMSKIFGSLMKTVYSVGNIPINVKHRRLNPIKAQTKELTKLLRRASSTAFGEHYHFDEILKSDNIFDTYRKYVPIFDYNSMYKNWWFRALNGETFVTWPGKIKYFALSSEYSSGCKNSPLSKKE